MLLGSRPLTVVCIAVMGLCLWPAAPARAQDVESQVRDLLRGLMGGQETEEETETDAEEDGALEQERSRREGNPIDPSNTSISVSDAGTVTLNATDVSLSAVLQLLSMHSQRNIIATPNVQGVVTASLYQVTFEEALDAILIANNAGYRAQGKFIYVYTAEELSEIIASETPPESKVFRLNYVQSSDVEPAITPLLSSIGSVSSSAAPGEGLSSSSEEGGGQSLTAQDFIVVFDRPENLDAIGQVIKQMDVRPKQVLVEATILSAQLNDDNALGVDFTILGGVDLELLGSTSTAIQDLTLGALPTVRLEKFNSNVQTQFTDKVPPGGIKIGILKDHVAVFVRALEQVTDTVVLANPKVLALNKQKGQVIVGRRDGYVTTTVTETQSIQTIEFLETGTQLIFRPFIGDDDWIRMELHPEDSIGGLTASNLPFEQTTEVTTNVMIKDGQTILIGGLFREVSTDSRAQVPLLGDIPWIGSVFQSHNDSTQRQEVIILLTVHIIKDFDAYAHDSRQQLNDIERIRIGLRRGMMWHGRERLAQSLYQRALDHFAVGQYKKSLWYTRLSIYNNPRFLSAIKLQEDLRQRREWDDDGTVTRGFIHQAIMRERGLVEPIFARPAPPFVRPDMLKGPTGFDDQSVVTENADVQG